MWEPFVAAFARAPREIGLFNIRLREGSPTFSKVCQRSAPSGVTHQAYVELLPGYRQPGFDNQCKDFIRHLAKSYPSSIHISSRI